MSLISDKYREARGGYSRTHTITCEKCDSFICTYQKDGPGNLRRMYIDRITSPSVSISKKELLCPQGHLLGFKINYEKEDRPAYRLFVDAVIKIVTSSKKVRFVSRVGAQTSETY